MRLPCSRSQILIWLSRELETATAAEKESGQGGMSVGLTWTADTGDDEDGCCDGGMVAAAVVVMIGDGCS